MRLQVHHVELEMQNAELCRKPGTEWKRCWRNLRHRPADDFAPVGYMSLDEQGRILEVNLTGAVLLGVGRAISSSSDACRRL